VFTAGLGGMRCTRGVTTVERQLDGWALDRAKGTKNAAIARLRPQQLTTALALVDVQARIGGHDFSRPKSAIGTGKGGLQDRWRMHWVAPNVAGNRPAEGASG
jgi:hypothetical protein